MYFIFFVLFTNGNELLMKYMGCRLNVISDAEIYEDYLKSDEMFYDGILLH